MAIKKTEGFSSYPGLGPGLRIAPKTVQSRAFIAGSGTLAPLTAVGMVTATGIYRAYAHAATDGSQIIRGFVYTEAVVLDATDEVLGNIMLEGKAHFDDVVLGGAATVAQFKAALRAAHGFGLIVEGIGI